MKINILSFFIAVCALQSVAQTTYQKTYGSTGSDGLTSMVKTNDGGFILAGDTYSYGLTKSDMFIIKLNAQGNPVWTKTFGGADYDYANAIIQTTDGGYAIAGSTGGNSGTFIRLVKLDSNGLVQWSKYFSGSKYNGANAIVQTQDGGYALGGYVQTYNNGSAGYLIKTDKEGTLLWSQKIFNFSFYPGILAMTAAKGGGFALMMNSTTTNPYYDMFLVKVSETGTFQWAKSIGGESTDFPRFINQTSDGGYIFGGASFSFANPLGQDMYVVRVDINGNKIWSKDIGTLSTDNATGSIETPDGGFIISGSTDSSSTFMQQPYFIKLSKSGNLQTSKILNVSSNTVISTNIVKADNGYAAAGSSGPTQDFYLVKSDNQGNVCGGYKEAAYIIDTGKLIDQIVPVTNIVTTVSQGSEVTIDRTGTLNILCATGPLLLKTSSLAQNAVNISIYPNPVKDNLILNIKSEQAGLMQLQIVSKDGKLVKTFLLDVVKGTNSQSFNISNLPNDFYLLQSQFGTEVNKLKFLKE